MFALRSDPVAPPTRHAPQGAKTATASHRAETQRLSHRRRRTIALALSALVHAFVVALLLPHWGVGASLDHRSQVHNAYVSVTLIAGDDAFATTAPPSQNLQHGFDTAAQPPQTRARTATSESAADNADEENASAAAPPDGQLMAGSASYRDALLSHIRRYRRYPDDARNNNVEGVVWMRFIMDRRGGVIDAWIERSSGDGALDREALATINRAQPLPRIPAELPERLGIAIPIEFSLSPSP